MTHPSDFYSDSQFIFDLDQVRNVHQNPDDQVSNSVEPPTSSRIITEAQNNYRLLTSDDLEFTRAHYFKAVKHGVVRLDDRVFSIYTNSLLHAKSAMRQYKLKSYLLNDVDPLSSCENAP